MVKVSQVSIWILLTLLTLPTLIGALACGKKGPPRVPESKIPAAVSDLRAITKESGVLLLWTMPSRNHDGSDLDGLGGFKIFRSETTFGAAECSHCPKRYKELADIVYGERPSENIRIKENKWEFMDRDLRYGMIYTYKILTYSSAGIFSKDSNTTQVSWDESLLGGE